MFLPATVTFRVPREFIVSVVLALVPIIVAMMAMIVSNVSVFLALVLILAMMFTKICKPPVT